MAKAGELPVLDIVAGAAALEEDIPRVLDLLEAPYLEALGWSRPSKTVLLIPMLAGSAGKGEAYLMRLGFQAYRAWPPSAQFVNPHTKTFSDPADRIYVPKLTSEECRTHTNYQFQGRGRQLICCSATLEFYEVLHSVEERHVWRDGQTFYSTIVAVQRAMATSYAGRFDANGS